MKRVSIIGIVIKLVLLVVIPLLVATGIGIYAYGRYKNVYGAIYINDISYKNTEEKIDKYVKYCSAYYEELTELENSVQTDGYVLNAAGDKLFSIKAFRWFDVTTTGTSTMNYIIILYNINYGNIYYSIYEKGKKDIKFVGYLPTFEIIVTDSGEDLESDEDDHVSKTVFAYNSEFTVEDYKYVGYTKDDGTETQKYEDGSQISSNVDTKWAMITPDTAFSNNVNITINAIDSKYYGNNDEELVKASTVKTVDVDIDNYYTRLNRFDSEVGTYYDVELSKGFNQDVKAAGYNAYVWKHYLWWEMLIAVVLTLIVTGSTVLVWKADIKANEAKEHKNKK